MNNAQLANRVLLGGTALSMVALLGTPGAVGAATSKVTANAILQFQGTAGPGLDPISNTYTCEYQNLLTIFDGLFQETSDGAFKPVLATAYKLLPNNVLQLTLRKGVKFQDGTTFDATAVKFNLNRAQHTPASTITKSLTGLTAVNVVNPTTVDLVMTGPDAGQLLVALATRAGLMASPTAVQKAGSEAAFAQNPVGAGPYKFTSMVGRQHLYVRKWTGYWDPKSQLMGGINFTEVPFTSVISALQAGNEQWVSPQTVQTANTLKSDQTVKVYISPGTVYNILVLNPTKAPFTNPLIREAVSYAITRQAVASTLAPGAKASYQQFQPGTPAYDPALTKKPYYPYSPKKAKKLLTQAGMPNGFTFTIVVGSSATLYVQQGEIIAQQLAKVGITMNVKTETISVVFGQVYGHGGSVQGASYGGVVTPDPLAEFQATFTPGGVTDAGNYTVPGVQTLVKQAAQTLTGPKRAKLFQKANDMVTKAVSNGVPLYFVPNINAIDKTVGGITHAQNYCHTNFTGIYIKKHK
jgi:ABC-type transport system substrate-binding protein